MLCPSESVQSLCDKRVGRVLPCIVLGPKTQVKGDAVPPSLFTQCRHRPRSPLPLPPSCGSHILVHTTSDTRPRATPRSEPVPCYPLRRPDVAGVRDARRHRAVVLQRRVLLLPVKCGLHLREVRVLVMPKEETRFAAVDVESPRSRSSRPPPPPSCRFPWSR